MKENSFILKKTSRQYPAEIITDADYVDNLAIFCKYACSIPIAAA